MFQKTFDCPGTFNSLYAAQNWLAERGYSYGPGSAMQPMVVLKGDYDIAKWKNLTKQEIAQLDGEDRWQLPRWAGNRDAESLAGCLTHHHLLR